MIASFVEARQALAGLDRALRDKRTPAAQALHAVRDGDSVAVGGCLYSRTPMALLLELLRQRRTGLTLSRCLTCYEGELFLAAGASDRIVTSWMGLGAPWGTSRILRTYVENGLAAYEEWSHLGIGLRYKAGAMGVSFLPMTSMLGSDLIARTDAKVMQCPFTGEQLCLVPALYPDVALVHVHRADRYGNAQIDGYTHMDVDVVRAARLVVLSAEEIVEPDRIASEPDRTVIPHFAVDAVVEAPFGSYPHECYGLYDADFTHFDAYVDRVKARGADGVRSYLDDYVYGTADFAGFLSRFDLPSALANRSRAQALVS